MDKNPAKSESSCRMSIEEYLEKVATFSGDEYGKAVRSQFKDIQGASELAMLACPTLEELEQLRRAVAIMTPTERENAKNLSDQQIQNIAADAKVDPGSLAIFINGYVLQRRKDNRPAQ